MVMTMMMLIMFVTETSAACLSDLLALCSPSAAITCDHLVSADFGVTADTEEIADADEVACLFSFLVLLWLIFILEF